MNAVHASTPTSNLLDLDRATFHDRFGRKPFRVRHRLCDHPLFVLPRLLELAKTLPEDRVEYNSGDVAVNMKPELTPRTGLSVEETIRRIEECRSWMVLKNVEKDPAYCELLWNCLAEVEGMGHPNSNGIVLREGFIFLSSPGAVTPYHMDLEWNFLLQIRGKKFMHVFDPAVLSEPELERAYSGAHRNMVHKAEYDARMELFDLDPGDGVHVPVTAPHWVKVGPEVSISFSITFQTMATERRSILYQVNHSLRQRGWNPTPVGVSGWRDGLKQFGYRVLRRLRRVTGKKSY